ncbi:MAG: hypothetical protein A3F26_01935 [Candidatus Ryanbacteria bacterium RIFCSPHIGHO2_12_FULL_47_12b]|uniref:Uncharacterized protein n=2 Tax=Candidatus Ryaniibacteriota TaxID=1817914 RepID=A0A1G2H6V9_9BACT|nr:MAG: hypothetical protein UY14_C0001G0031 [Parcubacteria group bacterium GW2011_GWA1_47_9]OGZ47764.1 MAG: hypothetical protein A3C83_01675 [Candidatus Ryanbacteria bacterium RIFCSPHIGHO2_02_FULL_47_25]OGZ51164.1 MAG: hypothetical protein A3F26_01935 [Candidatus Ryanbacteria bacterium RIFCSPHIGHO2_12_FULL_47_12b]OGZ55148.1 MAG: hypothetical protein A3J04_02785 [Candidatus Ryanbacteria bacterium RIFCSPLOWO2_02_FULL_47_14]OGZ58079.1 MAG: hypothetical protein A3G60_03450 [Candidatus Ryanbacteria
MQIFFWALGALLFLLPQTASAATLLLNMNLTTQEHEQIIRKHIEHAFKEAAPGSTCTVDFALMVFGNVPIFDVDGSLIRTDPIVRSKVIVVRYTAPPPYAVSTVPLKRVYNLIRRPFQWNKEIQGYIRVTDPAQGQKMTDKDMNVIDKNVPPRPALEGREIGTQVLAPFYIVLTDEPGLPEKLQQLPPVPPPRDFREAGELNHT